jgi:type IV secretory pathway VirB4 component
MTGTDMPPKVTTSTGSNVQQFFEGIAGEFIPGNTPAVAQVAGASQGLNPLTALEKALTNRGTWVRVAEVVIGGLMILVGLTALAKPALSAAAKVAK